MPKEQKQGYYDSLTPLQKGTYARFYELQKKYEQDKYETAARQSGDLAAERVSRFKILTDEDPLLRDIMNGQLEQDLGIVLPSTRERFQKMMKELEEEEKASKNTKN